MPRRYFFLLFLLCASLAIAQEKTIALTGTIVTPDEVIPKGTVLIRDGIIQEVGADVKIPKSAIWIDHAGIIAPGLIDLHNHMTWNVLPRWQAGQKFGTRYEWQALTSYRMQLAAPHQALVDAGLECDAEQYAELKALAAGETSVTGSSKDPSCAHQLVRNLDIDPRLGARDPGRVIYNVFPLRMKPEEVADAKQALNHGGSLLIHVAEGAPGNREAAGEFNAVKKMGLLAPGVSLIHGVALTPQDFVAMDKAGVGLIWSPRSNMELYGGTVDLEAALASHVTIALAPDWSPTGSNGMLDELWYAAIWNAAQPRPLFDDHQLFDMATVNAARLVHLDKVLGRIAPGYAADLIVVNYRTLPPGKDTWWALDHTSPDDVFLVMVGGVAVYGADWWIKQINGAQVRTESLPGCGYRDPIDPALNHSFTPHIDANLIERPVPHDREQLKFWDLSDGLARALAPWRQNLAPLVECGP
jgi:5-methylthioadenosine/S-adenosylhomocysteine deaminase